MHYYLCLLLSFLTYSNSSPLEEKPDRLKCFESRKMEGCTETLTSRYGNVSMSFTNKSRAETWIHLFTKRNPRKPEFLHDCGGQLPTNTYFDPSSPTEIFFHDYLDRPCLTLWQEEMKDQLLEKGSYNVILLDYSWANSFDYFLAIENGMVIADQIAIVIWNIMGQTGVTSTNFHLIGHGLGAQIAAFIGKRVKIRRITALDPAGPVFVNKPPEQRLHHTDADLVDVIHTNGGNGCLIPYSLGDINPRGHVDFYPNGGEFMPSCKLSNILSYFEGDIMYIRALPHPDLCTHFQAILYYKASINPHDCEFVGVKCKDYETFQKGECHKCGSNGKQCAVMGMDLEMYYNQKDTTSTGVKYYLNTGLSCPFCNNSGVELEGFSWKPPAKA